MTYKIFPQHFASDADKSGNIYIFEDQIKNEYKQQI